MIGVNLHYGQYKVCDILKYRTHRLCGLRQELTRLGYHVELYPSQHWDRLEVEVAGRNIFTCRLSFLEYNCKYEDDVLANKIIHAIQTAFYDLDIPEPEIPQTFVLPTPPEPTEYPTPIPSPVSAIPSANIPVETPILDDSYIPIHVVQPQVSLPKICRDCSECIPFCTCPEIVEEPVYKSCNVCGPYCVCKKIPSSEFINLCTKCGDTCLCSSDSERSLNICNVIIKPKHDERAERPFARKYGGVICDECTVCKCDKPICF